MLYQSLYAVKDMMMKSNTIVYIYIAAKRDDWRLLVTHPAPSSQVECAPNIERMMIP